MSKSCLRAQQFLKNDFQGIDRFAFQLFTLVSGRSGSMPRENLLLPALGPSRSFTRAQCSSSEKRVMHFSWRLIMGRKSLHCMALSYARSYTACGLYCSYKKFLFLATRGAERIMLFTLRCCRPPGQLKQLFPALPTASECTSADGMNFPLLEN